MRIQRAKINANFKRTKPLFNTRGDTMLIQAFIRIIKDYMANQGISVGRLCAMLETDGRIHFTKHTYNNWINGRAHPKTYLYSLFVIADVLGLSLFDIITIHYPEEKESIKAILKNPDYM